MIAACLQLGPQYNSPLVSRPSEQRIMAGSPKTGHGLIQACALCHAGERPLLERSLASSILPEEHIENDNEKDGNAC